MPNFPLLPDYTERERLGTPIIVPPQREVDLTHATSPEVPAPIDSALHFGGEPGETACGKPRAHLAVTDLRTVFDQARAGHLTAHPRVCDACKAATEGSGGPYRTKG